MFTNIEFLSNFHKFIWAQQVRSLILLYFTYAFNTKLEVHGTRQNLAKSRRETCFKQECIPVGCVLPAHWPYLVVSATHASPVAVVSVSSWWAWRTVACSKLLVDVTRFTPIYTIVDLPWPRREPGDHVSEHQMYLPPQGLSVGRPALHATGKYSYLNSV